MTILYSAAAIDEPSAKWRPAPRTRSLWTTDFDELATGFPGWEMRLVQLGHGRFQGRVVLAQQGRFQLYEVEGNRAILARGDSPPGSYEFNVIHARNTDAFWRGRTLRPGNVSIRRPGERMDHQTCENYRSTGLTLDAEFVRRVASSLHGVDAESILRGPLVSIGRTRGLALDRSLRQALGRLSRWSDRDLDDFDLAEFLVDWLSELLGHALADRFDESPSLGPRRRADVVRRADEYLFAHLERRLSLLEICEFVGVSERTLLYAFRERTGQSPKVYLKNLKLNRLRHDLKQADPQTDSVHQLARRWGLDHSGALAADYQKLFGERPAQTLRDRK
jgi:AraC family transcriptional regulator, ethanolamine operon transcriptional activator